MILPHSLTQKKLYFFCIYFPFDGSTITTIKTERERTKKKQIEK